MFEKKYDLSTTLLRKYITHYHRLYYEKEMNRFLVLCHRRLLIRP